MYPDDKYRAFILGMADAETEAAVEEGILDGRIDPDRLQQIEEELIDDHLFGRLSMDEERIFESALLSAPRRTSKLEFARALHHYAVRHAPEAKRRVLFVKLRGLVAVPWILPLAGALGCALLAVIWLGERNLRLSHELAQVTQVNDDHQRMIASMLEDRAGRTNQPAASIRTTESEPGPASIPDHTAAQPSIRLSPGVSRRLTTVPTLHVSRQASTVSFALELPFDLVGTLREELLNSEDKTIWSQQFFITGGISNNGITTIVLPAGLLATDEYRLRVETGTNREEPGNTVTYLFRVRKIE